jgi:large subunit ribosomal protein L2
LGKRPLVRRRGRGGNQFRSTSTGKVGKKANYPRFPLSEQHTGEIIDLVHERGREAPLSKIRFEDGSVSFVPAVLGTSVGTTLQFGLKSTIEKGNVISVQNIPDGTIVCNIEKHFGDGGAIVKSAGTDATIFSHGDDGVTVKLPSGKFATLNRVVLKLKERNIQLLEVLLKQHMYTHTVVVVTNTLDKVPLFHEMLLQVQR